jgi:periplasmic protein TonB
MNPEIGQVLARREKTPLHRAFSAAFALEALLLLALIWWLSQPVTMAKSEDRGPIVLTLEAPEAAPVPEVPPLPKKTPTIEPNKPMPTPAPTQEPTPPVAAAADKSEPEATMTTPAVPAPPVRSTVDAVASFESQVRAAVQAVVEFPTAARMMRREGQARVAFDYLDGQVSEIRMAQSSGLQLFDEAALAAVRLARQPQAPAEFRHRVLHLSVWVQFRLSHTQ